MIEVESRVDQPTIFSQSSEVAGLDCPRLRLDADHPMRSRYRPEVGRLVADENPQIHETSAKYYASLVLQGQYQSARMSIERISLVTQGLPATDSFGR